MVPDSLIFHFRKISVFNINVHPNSYTAKNSLKELQNKQKSGLSLM